MTTRTYYITLMEQEEQEDLLSDGMVKIEWNFMQIMENAFYDVILNTSIKKKIVCGFLICCWR